MGPVSRKGFGQWETILTKTPGVNSVTLDFKTICLRARPEAVGNKRIAVKLG